MVTSKICIVSLVLSLHAANSYILLTANVEDMHSLAQQIAASPVANQLNQIMNRASAIFSQQYNRGSKAQMRSDLNLDGDNDGQEQKPMEKDEKTKLTTNTEDDEVWKPNEKELNAKVSDSSSDSSAEANDVQQAKTARRLQSGKDLIELGKNASFYLSSIKKIFESV